MSENEDLIKEYRVKEQATSPFNTWIFGVLCGAAIVLGWFSPEIFG